MPITKLLMNRKYGSAESNTSPIDPDTLEAIAKLRLTLSDQGDLSGARALQESVLTARRRDLENDHSDMLIDTSNLALTLPLESGGVANPQERL